MTHQELRDKIIDGAKTGATISGPHNVALSVVYLADTLAKLGIEDIGDAIKSVAAELS